MASDRRGKRLRDRISEPQTLERAWRSVRSGTHKMSRGPDGVTLLEFQRRVPDELKKLRDELRLGTYCFGGYRGVAIKKTSDASPDDQKGWRPISIASIRDRVVQRAILDRIWVHVRDRVHTPASHGGVRSYRTKRGTAVGPVSLREHGKKSVSSAARQIVDLRTQGYEWVMETDIERFFQSVRKDRLLELLRLPDDSINDIIEAAINTSVVNQERLSDGQKRLWDAEYGVPQGGVLSPTFANLYLYDFDCALERAGFRPVRYVDDLVVLTRSEDEARAAYDICRQELGILGLTIHPLGIESGARVKTAIRGPKERFEFLGLQFGRNSIRPVEAKLGALRERIDQLTDATTQWPLIKVIEQVNRYTKGWVEAYSFCNLSKGDLRAIDAAIEKRIRGWLFRRSFIRTPQRLSPQAYCDLGVYRVESAYIKPILSARRGGENVHPGTDAQGQKSA